MSSNTEARGAEDSRRAAAEAVRQAFSALPFGDKLSTLARVELDMLGDFADSIFSAVEKVADEIVDVFTCSDAPAPAQPAGE